MKLKRADGSEIETTPYMTIPGAGRLDLSKFHMVYEPPQPDNVLRNADGTPYQAGYDEAVSDKTVLVIGYRDMVLRAYEYADCIDSSIEEEMRRLDAIARSLHIDIKGEAKK